MRERLTTPTALEQQAKPAPVARPRPPRLRAVLGIALLFWLLLLFKQTLADTLRNDADAAAVWIGANEFRANFGYLYDGGDPGPLVENLRHDVGEVLDFVRRQNASLHLVVANLPDLGVAPSQQTAHPDPAKRERITAATALANQAIHDLATTAPIQPAHGWRRCARNGPRTSRHGPTCRRETSS